ncbi:MAG: putative DNA-binding protein [Clostridia bacterium]|nr:putative DNA-binding protein [Clostridia bacterium]
MDKKIEISWMLDFYGKLLTEKQLGIMEMYFNEDSSLSEIASSLGVSKQAVHDIIHRSEAILYEYEKKLGLLEQFQYMEKQLNDISKRLRTCNNENEKQAICNEIDKLITMWEE